MLMPSPQTSNCSSAWWRITSTTGDPRTGSGLIKILPREQSVILSCEIFTEKVVERLLLCYAISCYGH